MCSVPKDFFVEGKRYMKRLSIVAERETVMGTVSILEKDSRVWIEAYKPNGEQSSWVHSVKSVKEAKELVYQNCKPVADEDIINF